MMTLRHFLLKVSISTTLALIIFIYGIFHFLRLRYRNSKPPKNKCINLATVSYLVIICALFARLFVIFFGDIPSYFHSSISFMNEGTCTDYVKTVSEFTIIIKFGVHLFVVLRSRIAEINNGKTSIWFKIVCIQLTELLSLYDHPNIFFGHESWRLYGHILYEKVCAHLMN